MKSKLCIFNFYYKDISMLLQRVIISTLLSIVFSTISNAQKITFAEVDREDKGEVNFEIIGKLDNNFLVYKNSRWKHRITIYNTNMQEVETVNLDFLPEKTFNVDVVAYADKFYMIYQFQKKNIVHCMGVKMNAMAKQVNEPVEIDTTQLSFFSDNKIYNVVKSDSKEYFVVYKTVIKNNNYTLGAKLFNNQLNLVGTGRNKLEYNDRRDTYTNFEVDNDGNFTFTKETKEGNRSNNYKLSLFQLNFNTSTLAEYKAPLNNNYIDNVNLKIDNLNKRYVINSFYYTKARGNIEGLYSFVFNKVDTSLNFKTFSVLNDSVRDMAKTQGQSKYALNDFFIQKVIVKKDGGYIVVSEDFNSQQTGNNFNNPWNRWDYLYNPYGFSNRLYYNPYYGYYRSPGFNNQVSTRYYYENILINSFDKNANIEWSTALKKSQSEDDIESFLSFSLIPLNSELHFLFNMDRRNQILADNSISSNGTIKRNPPLKSEQKGHQFMPRFAKQVSSKQLIVPCDFRGFLTFAKIDMP
jgi:hypothetical protein